jgi:hypothetical protein
VVHLLHFDPQGSFYLLLVPVEGRVPPDLLGEVDGRAEGDGLVDGDGLEYW